MLVGSPYVGYNLDLITSKPPLPCSPENWPTSESHHRKRHSLLSAHPRLPPSRIASLRSKILIPRSNSCEFVSIRGFPSPAAVSNQKSNKSKNNYGWDILCPTPSVMIAHNEDKDQHRISKKTAVTRQPQSCHPLLRPPPRSRSMQFEDN